MVFLNNFDVKPTVGTLRLELKMWVCVVIFFFFVGFFLTTLGMSKGLELPGSSLLSCAVPSATVGLAQPLCSLPAGPASLIDFHLSAEQMEQ